MSEQLDRDLSRAIKQEIGHEMQGFEFSAAMKANVMKQIRAGQSGLVVPFERPTARRKFVLPRPLIWTAVAVAAFAFAFNLNMGLKDSLMGATEEAPGMTGLRAAHPAAPEPPMPALALEAAPAEAVEQKGLSSDMVLAPTRMIELKGAANRTPAPAAVPSPSFAVQSWNLHVAPIDQDLMVVASDGIRRLDPTHNLVWQYNPGGITPQSTLDVNTAGVSALSAGDKVHLISPNGVLERTLVAPTSVTHVAWGADNRIAVTSGAWLTVFQGDRVEYRVDVAPGTNASFLRSGSLVVFSDQLNRRSLAVYDTSGNRTFQLDLPEAGKGLAIMDGGQMILAGGVAVDLTGQVLWKQTFQPSGVTAAPNSELIVAWSEDSVTAVRPDGHEVWRARLVGSLMRQAKISDDGSRVVVVATAGAESGAEIFVLAMTGEVLLSERAATVPVDATVTGNRLFLLHRQGQQEFALR